MEWLQVLATIIPLGVFIFAMLSKFETSIRNEVNRVDIQLQAHIMRSDRQFKQQSDRTDKLYQMFVDLIKEQRKEKK